MSLLLLASCDDGITLHVTLRVHLGVSPDPAPSGATLRFTLENEGDETVGADRGGFSFLVEESAGDEVRRIDGPPERVRLAPGESLTVSWDQTDAAGSPVTPGDYRVSVRFRVNGGADTRERAFTIGSASRPR